LKNIGGKRQIFNPIFWPNKSPSPFPGGRGVSVEQDGKKDHRIFENGWFFYLHA